MSDVLLLELEKDIEEKRNLPFFLYLLLVTIREPDFSDFSFHLSKQSFLTLNFTEFTIDFSVL